MANDGVNALAGILQNRMKNLGDKPPVLDFGTIQADMSLLTDRFPVTIPLNDYMVCRSVVLDCADRADIFTSTWNDGNHPHGESGQHPHGTSGRHPHGMSGEHPHGESGEHEHIISPTEEIPPNYIITGGKHEHPDTEGAHEHPDTEGEHNHPDTEGMHIHPDTEGIHSHKVYFPASMKSLQPGDRALIAWVGNTCTVIDLIFPARIINQNIHNTEG